MREDGKRKKKRADRLLSHGVILLVLILLTIQSVCFIGYLIRNGRDAGVPVQVSSSSRMDTSSRQASPAGMQSRTTAHTPSAAPQASPGKAAKASSDEARRASPQPVPHASGKQREPIHDGWKWDMVELNSADSAALDDLPGIGPYYARQILRYRERLGCYADISQLLDIRGIDTTLLARIRQRLYIEPASIIRLDLKTMSIDSMSAHPYIGPYAAKGIDRFRRTVPEEEFSIEALVSNGILPPARASRLRLYIVRE